MLKKIFSFFKKIIFSVFLLYGYNLIASSFNMVIPINVITVLTLSIFGLPSLFALIIILIIIF
ncbi:MAG: pro-sigmaK processing inhibitor BofA family protein [Bacilli bacterium]|nr:pro-sigmaK processing inhibitor BofA family protein [Bacilli bacterium]